MVGEECRFYLGVNLCERSPIGYAVKRRCVIAKDDSIVAIVVVGTAWHQRTVNPRHRYDTQSH